MEGWSNFIEALHEAHDEMAAAHAVQRLANDLGFGSFAYLNLRAERPALMSTYPAAWTDHYLANGFEAIDPVVAAARTSSAPFLWGSNGDVRPESNDARGLFDDASAFGIVSGITVPFRDGRGFSAALSLATDDRRRGGRSLERSLEMVQVAGLQLHSHLMNRIPRFIRPDRPMLTARQTSCLAASAGGRSAKEIARLTGLVPRTVEHHLNEAKRRLDAESLPHAVALAVRSRIIP